MIFIFTICLHHEQAFTSHFHLDKKRSNCENPFGNHEVNRKLPKGTIYPSLNMCDSMKMIRPNFYVFPGQKLCPNCYMTFLLLNVIKKKKYQIFLSHIANSQNWVTVRRL